MGRLYTHVHRVGGGTCVISTEWNGKLVCQKNDEGKKKKKKNVERSTTDAARNRKTKTRKQNERKLNLIVPCR